MMNSKLLRLSLKTFNFLLVFLTFNFLFLTSAYAQVDLKSAYPIARNPNIQTLGGGVRLLVVPAFSVAAAMVVFYFLFGAFKYIVARGEKEQLQEARNMMTHAIIGFIILIAVFFIMQYIHEVFPIIPNII